MDQETHEYLLLIGIVVIVCVIAILYRFRRINILDILDIHYNNKRDLYSDYLRGKNVILVGPAEHVDNSELIDSFDVVVRLNRGLNLVKNTNKYGYKANIIYMSNKESYNTLNSEEINNLDFIKFQFPDVSDNELHEPPTKDVQNEYKTIPFSDKILRCDKKYLNFEKKLQSRPFIGTVAIWDLLQYDIKSLYITGITFAKTKYSDNYNGSQQNQHIMNNIKNNIIGTHNINNMIQWTKGNVITDSRVSYDKEFYYSLYN
jgi:hypothetical protein